MIVLASQSPRRAELLRQIGIAFRTCPADIDESPLPGEMPAAYVERMATTKATAVRQQQPKMPVLGSDTAVVIDDEILGKPVGRDDAIRMLLTLSGRTHEVLTGVAISDGQVSYRLNRSKVTFRDLNADEAAAYWDSGEPADKAGGYAIQGLGAAFVANINGSYSGIMGLPLFETLQLLAAIGIPPAADV